MRPLARWLKDFGGRLLGAAPQPTRRHRARLGVESLEDRAVPAAHTWTGAVDDNWSTAGNWIGGVPTTGEIGGTVVNFPTLDATIVVDAGVAGLVVDQINFASNSILTLATPLGLSGAVLTTNLTTSAGGFIEGGALDLVGVPVFDIGTPLAITSQLTGMGGFRKQGASTLTLNTAVAAGNTYTGTTFIDNGVLQLLTDTDDAALSNVIVVGDGVGAGQTAQLQLMANSFELPDSAAVTVNSDGWLTVMGSITEDITALTVNGLVGISPSAVLEIAPGGTVTTNSSGTISASGGTPGTLRLQGAATFDIADSPGASDLAVDARISRTGAGGLTKVGAGTLALFTSATSPIDVTVAAGTVVTGSAATTISGSVTLTGGTFAGVGTVGAVGGTGGVVAPGGLEGVGQFTGDLSLNNLTYQLVVSRTASSRLNVTGTVTLTGSALSASRLGGALPSGESGPVAAGTVLTIIANDGTDAVVGTFAGLPQGATVTIGGQGFTISYTGGTGNDVTLTALGTGGTGGAGAPVYSDLRVIGNFLVIQGAGGMQVIPVPPGTTVIFADLTGDGSSDGVLFLPTLALVVDGQTGRILALASDVNGDLVRDLQIFNLDGTVTTTDGRTGRRI